jgi:hypothetical protein
VPVELLRHLLREQAPKHQGPFSVFLSDGTRHPGEACLRELRDLCDLSLATAIPRPRHRQRRRSKNALADIIGSVPDCRLTDKALAKGDREFPPVARRPGSFSAWKDPTTASFAAFIYPPRVHGRLRLRNFIACEGRLGVCRWCENEEILL